MDYRREHRNYALGVCESLHLLLVICAVDR